MERIDWKKVKYFKELRRRRDIKGVKPELIYTLDNWRDFLGYKIYVSPIDGAIVATRGHSPNSYHYKGMAIDVFPECLPIITFSALFKYNPFGAVGFYFDTHYRNRPYMMCHFDLRPRKDDGKELTVWFRKDGKYYYQGMYNKKEVFWEELLDNMVEMEKYYEDEIHSKE